MNERIKELRKALGLNQTDFGKIIGIKQGSVAGYETGARVPLDAIINSICKEFNVNELWLRKGIGEMFNRPQENNELGTYIEEMLIGTNDKVYKAIKSFLMVYGQLNTDSKKVLNNFLDDLIDELKKEQN